MIMTAPARAAKTTQSASNKSLLSQKPIPPKERLIFAMDVSSTEKAKALVDQLGDSVVFYKLGLQMIFAQGFYELIEWLRDKGKKVLVDAKIFDVPETVKSVLPQLKNRGVTFVTVHGNDEIMKAAVQEKNGVRILAVTVLTSLDEADLKDLGFECDVKTLVLNRAKRALEIGCDGVISSGLEAPELRKNYGENFVIVTPGIRPLENRSIPDDQKRVATVEEAFLGGADYIVVGRPIRDAKDPKAKAEEIQATIRTLFEG